ncbi:MAG: Gfo/Idh/MocA family oxidoreductase [Leptolinea sp.]|jgi:predicted dehydrogenase|nr:Gfo/Idh/MocA family oxidoreductase [Leptolinea sp.]
MIKIGVIGYGYWGPNLVRNFAETKDAQVTFVSDRNPDRLKLVRSRYPSINVTENPVDLINNPQVDVVIISTPVSTHYDLAVKALRAGRHVLVEKPMTGTVEEAEKLLDEAARAKRVLMVDHTFIYTPAVIKIKELVADGSLGNMFYYDSVRVNLGLFQHDVNVLWDLAVHDLSIMDFILGKQPTAISATGMAHLEGQPEDVAYITCYLQNNLIAHFHVNWMAPVKVRRTLIGGDRKMIVYDDIEPSEKIKVYDKGVSLSGGAEGVYQLLVNYRSGDMWAPHLATTEALKTEAAHFIDCVTNGTHPQTDGEMGLRIVQILEAADASMAKKGQPVELV